MPSRSLFDLRSGSAESRGEDCTTSGSRSLSGVIAFTVLDPSIGVVAKQDGAGPSLVIEAANRLIGTCCSRNEVSGRCKLHQKFHHRGDAPSVSAACIATPIS